MISAAPNASPAEAVTVAVPWPAARTSPAESTTATPSSSDRQPMTASATAYPFASVGVASSRTVSSTDSSRTAAGETATAVTSCATVISAVPDASPAEAVTVAVPWPAARTSPAESTAATAPSLLVHDTVTPVMICPLWSRTSAASSAVCSIATSRTPPGVTVTAAGCGGGGGGGGIVGGGGGGGGFVGPVVAPSPQERIANRPMATAVRGRSRHEILNIFRVRRCGVLSPPSRAARYPSKWGGSRLPPVPRARGRYGSGSDGAPRRWRARTRANATGCAPPPRIRSSRRSSRGSRVHRGL